MIVSQKGQLALAAVLELALQPDGLRLPAKTLAARQGLPPRHLEPVLRALTSHGILKSFRGPHGGYWLACDPRAVTANDILRAAGTEEVPDEAPKSLLVDEVVRPLLAGIEKECAQALSRISVDDMVNRAAKNVGGNRRNEKSENHAA